MHRAQAAFETLGFVRARTYALLAEACGRTDDSSVGLKTVSEDMSLMAAVEDRSHDADLRRIKGELLMMQGAESATEAERCFRTGIEVARAQKGKSLELRATVSLARLLAKQGRRDDGRVMLAEIYDWFTEGFDTADLKDAKSLLDELSA